MRFQTIIRGAALAAVLTIPARARAQQTFTVPRDCAKVARIVDRGHPAKKQEAAYSALLSCPKESVNVYAVVYQDLRTSTDTAALEWLVTESTGWRDGQLFAAAAATADDPTATAEARTYALVALERFLRPRAYHPVLHPSASIRPDEVGSRTCYYESRSDVGQRDGPTPLPADAMSQLHALARRLATDPSAPPLVRRTAACMG